MNTQTIERPNVFKKDADGHWYSLPENMVDMFIQAVESIMLAEFMSDEWHDANDYLNDAFGEYMRGDL